MKALNILISLFVLLIFFNSCKKDSEIDTIKPEIDLNIQNAFPVNCDTLYFGESFVLNLLFTDNIELGSYSIDIHQNFDHHSHSTEVTECSLNPIKDPVNPFTFINEYDIPDNLAEFEPNESISIPASNAEGAFDEGDYHFFISLTDKEGWSVQKGLSIKILHK